VSKATSKLRLTIPKALADRLRIRPGDEVDWLEAGDGLRLIRRPVAKASDLAARLRAFDEATHRQAARQKGYVTSKTSDRSWIRAELYERGKPR
jgi:AbrB family looped-hinge helix DNA binding protein